MPSHLVLMIGQSGYNRQHSNDRTAQNLTASGSVNRQPACSDVTDSLQLYIRNRQELLHRGSVPRDWTVLLVRVWQWAEGNRRQQKKKKISYLKNNLLHAVVIVAWTLDLTSFLPHATLKGTHRKHNKHTFRFVNKPQTGNCSFDIDTEVSPRAVDPYGPWVTPDWYEVRKDNYPVRGYQLRWSSAVFNLLKPTGHVMYQQFNIQQLQVLPTLCFVFIWATCATYSINWLVFITEMKSVYCAVRTGSSNKAVCASYLKG